MSLAQKYYRLLNLPSTASVNAIKKAYRTKAKQLHPDRNPSPNAEEDFIELNEAYEYLIVLKTKGYSNTKSKQINDFEKWWRAEEAARKEKARQQAQMRYQKFLRETEEFKKFYRITLFFHFLFATISVFTLIIVPFIFISKIGFVPGIIAWVFLSAAISPLYTLTWSGIKDFFVMKEKVENMDNNAKL